MDQIGFLTRLPSSDSCYFQLIDIQDALALLSPAKIIVQCLTLAHIKKCSAHDFRLVALETFEPAYFQFPVSEFLIKVSSLAHWRQFTAEHLHDPRLTAVLTAEHLRSSDWHLWKYERLGAILLGENQLQHYKDQLSNLLMAPQTKLIITDLSASLDKLTLVSILQSRPYSPLQQFGIHYLNKHIQPMDPLNCNLQPSSYQVFHLDAAKYASYALAAAQHRENSPSSDRLVVAGAGHGGLVDACRHLWPVSLMVLIEKNYNAYLVLQEKYPEAQVLNCDIRDAAIPPNSLVISELIGLFGCNELAPECLGRSSALHFIPEKVTLWLAPGYGPCHAGLAPPFVSNYTNIQLLDNPSPAWLWAWPCNNIPRKTSRITFNTPNKVVHVLLGYFSAQLYREVTLSTVPGLETQGLVSWFPMVFPFEEGVYVPEGHEFVAVVTREQNAGWVWYEWAGHVYSRETLVSRTIVHNQGGRLARTKAA